MTILDNVSIQFTIAWLLQFSTIKRITGITTYDDCYYNLRQVLQFTTEQISHLGSLSINDGDGYEIKTSLKKWSRAVSNLIALIPSRSIRQMFSIFFPEMNSNRLYRLFCQSKPTVFLPSSLLKLPGNHTTQNITLVVYHLQKVSRNSVGN